MENFEKTLNVSTNHSFTNAFFFDFDLIDVCGSPHPLQSDGYPVSNSCHSVFHCNELDFMVGSGWSSLRSLKTPTLNIKYEVK